MKFDISQELNPKKIIDGISLAELSSVVSISEDEIPNMEELDVEISMEDFVTPIAKFEEIN